MAAVSMSKRTVALVVAIVLAALATLALVSYVRGVENRAYAGVATVQVYIAKDTIPQGMSGDDAIQKALIGTTTIPRKVVADGAVTSLDQIKGQVAQVTILKGEQIVAARWVAPGQAGTGLPIPTDMQAISIQVDIPHGVAGFIQNGDYVSIVAKLPQGPLGDRVQYLLQDVQVLQVGQRVVVTTTGKNAQGQQTTQQTSGVLLTVALRPVDVEKLAFASWEGEVYFTLVPNGQHQIATPGRTTANAFR